MTSALQGSLWRAGLAPGVFEEPPPFTRRPSIRLDIAAFVGLAERGPVLTPVPIDDMASFTAIFGRAKPGLQLPQAVRLFFANGGRRCVVVRCLNHSAARTARFNLPGLQLGDKLSGAVMRGAGVSVAARNPGSWGNGLMLTTSIQREPLPLNPIDPDVGLGTAADQLLPGTTVLLRSQDGEPNQLLWVRVVDPRIQVRRPVQLVASEDRPIGGNWHAETITITLEIHLDGRLAERWENAALHPEHPRFLPRLLGRRASSEVLRPSCRNGNNAESPEAEVDRLWGGAEDPWGSELLRPSATLAEAWLIPTTQLLNTPTGLSTSNQEGANDNDRLKGNPIDQEGPLAEDDSAEGGDGNEQMERCHFFDGAELEPDQDRADRFLTFAGRPGPFEAEGALARWDGAHPFEPVAMVSLPDLLHPSAPARAPGSPAPRAETPCFTPLCVTSSEKPTDPVVASPKLGFPAEDLQWWQRLIHECESHGGRIAMLDLPPGLNPSEVIRWRNDLASDRAALYAPWLRAEQNETSLTLPPSAVACGIVSRLERERGIWRAPANAAAVGVVACANDDARPSSSFLFEQRINEIRPTPQGLFMLGARTTSHDQSWTHLSIRRLMDWIKLQLVADLAWAAFEPNGPALWSSMKGTARRRLLGLLDAGAFAGTTDTESFFVRCDLSTNPPIDQDAGRTRMLIGVAPAVPAEFIVFSLIRAQDQKMQMELV